MEITFPLDIQALRRSRRLRLLPGTGRYKIPQADPVYQKAREFVDQYQNDGYEFVLLQLLHATGVKMLGLPSATPRNTTLFAAGGLYLALDQTHSDLAIHNTFDDFTSGFSHQFGVALAIMSMSEAFGIDWDNLTAIPVSSSQTLDYEAQIPETQNWLHLEAKGVTSEAGRASARRDAYCKKLVHPSPRQKSVNSPRRTHAQTTAMIGIIIEASRNNGKGVLEIIDPAFKIDAEVRRPENQKAGCYWHYSGVARFAGLNNVAEEFMNRANNLISGSPSRVKLRQISFQQKAEFERQGRELVGLQWRLSETADPAGGIWFYHGVEKERIRRIIEDDDFPECQPFSTRSLLNPSMDKEAVDTTAESGESTNVQRRQTAENLFPDGSFFGVGYGQIDGLLEVESQQTNLDKLGIASLS